MSECLDMLSKSSETPNDVVLVQLVSSWLIVDKISQGPWNVEHAGDKQTNRAPPAFHINAFESQLIDLVNRNPKELHENRMNSSFPSHTSAAFRTVTRCLPLY
jgi:hypothetical protein